MYLVDPAKVNLSHFELRSRIASQLTVPEGPQVLVPMATPSLHYACIIVPDSFPTAEQCVICVCVWDSLSYVAVRASKSVGSEYLRLALASAFCGDPDSLWKGSFESLTNAYLAARYNWTASQNAP